MVFVDVAWTDEFMSETRKPITNSIVVIVDTFRATTTIPAALDAGAKKLIVLKDTRTARKLKKEDPSAILAGEKGGIILPGFDVGNSPYGVRKLLKKSPGSTLILNTGNFSRVLEDIVGFVECPIITASAINQQAVVDYLTEACKKVESIYFVSTGTFYMEGETYNTPLRTLEDLFGALFVLNGLIINGVDVRLSERADHYLSEYSNVVSNAQSLVAALWDTHYAKYLLELDKQMGDNVNKNDLDVCVEVDTSPIVAVVRKTNGLLECVRSKEIIDQPRSL